MRLFAEGRGYNGPVKTRREELLRLLGDLPAVDNPPTGRLVETEQRSNYTLEHLELELNGLEPVPALFARPDNAEPPWPTVLYHHSHGDDYRIGKRELIDGRTYLQDPPYAKALTDQGWAALCIDAWVFGDRNHTSELDMFKAMLWQGRVLWGMMVFDAKRAVDYLVGRDDVEADRIGTLGMSMGSTMAWWLAALDERIRVVVDLCCLTDAHTFLRQGELHRHGIYYYVPGLLKHFSTAEINSLVAPRPHLAIVGREDPLTPAAGLETIDHELQRVYSERGASENWRLVGYRGGHEETSEGRREAIAFLKQHL